MFNRNYTVHSIYSIFLVTGALFKRCSSTFQMLPRPIAGAIQTDGDGGSAKERRDQIFLDMDKNEDANLSKAEFIEGAKSDASIVKILQSG